MIELDKLSKTFTQKNGKEFRAVDSVSLLVIFQDGNEPASRRQGAVQGGCGLGLAVLIAVTGG